MVQISPHQKDFFKPNRIDQSNGIKNEFSADGEKSFNAFGVVASITDPQVQADAYVKNQFPDPDPSMTCDQAAAIISQLSDYLEAKRKDIASGVTDRVGKRYASAYENRIAYFKSWMDGKGCAAQQKATADANFLTTSQNVLSGAQNQASSNAASLSHSKNWIYWGIGALAVLSLAVFVIKKVAHKS